MVKPEWLTEIYGITDKMHLGFCRGVLLRLRFYFVPIMVKKIYFQPTEAKSFRFPQIQLKEAEEK